MNRQIKDLHNNALSTCVDFGYIYGKISNVASIG